VREGYGFQWILAMPVAEFLLLLKSLDRIQSRERLESLVGIRAAVHADAKDFKGLTKAIQQRSDDKPRDEAAEEPETDHDRLMRDIANNPGFFGPK
jgi:hypothetical protein